MTEEVWLDLRIDRKSCWDNVFREVENEPASFDDLRRKSIVIWERDDGAENGLQATRILSEESSAASRPAVTQAELRPTSRYDVVLLGHPSKQ
ncbi:hypothetical protein PM082_007380 [Marasmius tenuissimus]|nr:hypothetical protein PM082_007380 [Marasmius tenuissimus]